MEGIGIPLLAGALATVLALLGLLSTAAGVDSRDGLGDGRTHRDRHPRQLP